MRVWDKKSGSQPLEDGRMLSRWPDLPLNTKEAREELLPNHLVHRIWKPTPYISFTKSAHAIEYLAKLRSGRQRGEQHLTVINPSTRLKLGLPILYVPTEMDHYEISDPCDNGGRYFTNHYVCLWEVTKEEIIDHYNWKELSKNPNWYEEVIMPAFDRSNREQEPGSDTTPAPAFDMSEVMKNLPSGSLASARVSDRPDLESSEDSDEPFEHDNLAYDDGTDSDDEAEEANRNDDIIRMIEGLYSGEQII
jgi:hypothetical protein